MPLAAFEHLLSQSIACRRCLWPFGAQFLGNTATQTWQCGQTLQQCSWSCCVAGSIAKSSGFEQHCSTETPAVVHVTAVFSLQTLLCAELVCCYTPHWQLGCFGQISVCGVPFRAWLRIVQHACGAFRWGRQVSSCQLLSCCCCVVCSAKQVGSIKQTFSARCLLCGACARVCVRRGVYAQVCPGAAACVHAWRQNDGIWMHAC